MNFTHAIRLSAALLATGTGLALASPAQADTMSRECLVDSVAVIDGRMHIKCAPIATVAHTSAIRYFALPLSEPQAKIDGLIMLAIESKRIKKPMVIWFDMADYKSVPGCLGSDCRRLKGAALE